MTQLTTDAARPLPTGLVAGAQAKGIVPTTFDDVQRIAATAVAAGYIDPYLKADDEAARKKAVAKASMVIMMGMELGLSPMQSFNGIASINGRTTIWGKLARARIQAAGHKIEERVEGKDTDGETHYCKITRKDGSYWKETSFSVVDAKRAGLWSPEPKVQKMVWDDSARRKTKQLVDNDSTWHKYPGRMLGWRAFGHCATDVCSDCLLGLDLAEIIRDVPTEEDRGSISAPAPVPPPPAEAAPPAVTEEDEIEQALIETVVDSTPVVVEPPAPNMSIAIATLAGRLDATNSIDVVGLLISEFEESYDGHITPAIDTELGRMHGEALDRIAAAESLNAKKKKE